MAERRDQHREQVSKAATDRAPAGSPPSADTKLARLANKLGNESIQQRFSEANGSRDLMLSHLCERLRTIHELQQREISLTQRGSHFEWWRSAADSHKEGSQEPRPMRWGECARMYEDAAQHLCTGDLKRGKDLLDRAMQEEQRAREGMTGLVDTAGVREGSITMDLPQGTLVAGACGVPEDVKLAREIYNVTIEEPKMPNRGRAADPWWTVEEEEEEPGGPGGA